MTSGIRWNSLTGPQRVAVVGGGLAELALTTFALLDLVRRPARELRGSRVAWILACAVQPFGPPAYLIWGRRPPQHRHR
jgi:Phospholipase_D-nuclease N-terminal